MYVATFVLVLTSLCENPFCLKVLDILCVSPAGKSPAGCAAFHLVSPNVELEESGIKEDKEQSEGMDIRTFFVTQDRSPLIQSQEQQPRSPLIQLKERSLPFQSNDQHPLGPFVKQTFRFYSEWYFFQQSSPPPPQPSTAVHAYALTCKLLTKN